MTYYLVLILSGIGAAETVYLIRKRRARKNPVCIVGRGCDVVLQSKYNKFWGIHNDVLGLLFFLFLILLSVLIITGTGPIRSWEIISQASLILAGALSAYLIYVQWKILNSWCFWCLMSAITVFLLILVVFLT